MAERVCTPEGEVLVLTDQEMEAQIRASQELIKEKYFQREGGTYQNSWQFNCRECGGIVLVATIFHPVWDGPFLMSGSGKCFREFVPYCPKCEEKPSERGCPIAPKGSYHNPFRVAIQIE